MCSPASASSAGLATGLSLADAPFPQFGTDVKDLQTFFQDSSGAERINVAGQLLSAGSLAVFSRSVAQLGGRSGSKMLKAAAIAGGAVASTSLAASATAAAALTSERGRDDDQARSLHRFLFLREGQCTVVALLLSSLGLATAAAAKAAIASGRGALVIPAGRLPAS